MQFDRYCGRIAAEVSVKFQSDAIIYIANFTSSRLHEILR